MTCPKCNKELGDLQVCPDCVAAAAIAKAANKKSKIIGMAVFAFLMVTMVLSIVSTVPLFKAEKEPAEDAKWNVIMSDFIKNEQSAEEEYRKKRLTFYVYVESIDDFGANVRFYEKNWKEINIRYSCRFVDFSNPSEVERGGWYVITGNLTDADYRNGALYSIRISNAKVVERITD